MKLISDSYLYQVADYGKNLFDFLMSAERVNKNDEAFSDVVYAIKKQANATLMKVLMSNKIVLLIGDKGISRAFKVIYAKDFKDDNVGFSRFTGGFNHICFACRTVSGNQPWRGGSSAVRHGDPGGVRQDEKDG